MRIGVVDIAEAGPDGGREFEAEETSAEFQHTVRLTQRRGNVSHVPDAKSDGVGVEAAIRIGQLFGIGLGPDQAVDAAFRRTIDADSEHFGIDVRNGDRGAGSGHAKGDVARAAGHIEDVFALTRFDARDELVLPQPVHPARHGIVHPVVIARHIGEDFPDARSLFSCGDVFVTEGDGVGHGGPLGRNCAAAKPRRRSSPCESGAGGGNRTHTPCGTGF